MRHILAVATAVLPIAALAQSPASEQDHAAHHPPGASAPAPTFRVPANKPPNPAVSKTQADATMKSMRDMHDKMTAARTPEERQALMADHMEAMQDGAAMMGKMEGARPDGGMAGSMSMSAETMDMRMDMMEMMMQMMMDREAARTPAAK